MDTNQSAGLDYDEAAHLWEGVGGVWGGGGERIRIGLIAINQVLSSPTYTRLMAILKGKIMIKMKHKMKHFTPT